MTTTKRGQPNNVALWPRISFSRASESYLIFNGKVHKLGTCDTRIFKAALQEVLSKDELNRFSQTNSMKYSMWHYREIDMLGRFYLINLLPNKLKLYSSQTEAEKACEAL
jgi:hypothetical protein